LFPFLLAIILTYNNRPILGGIIVNRQGWRWTQWTILLFCIPTIIFTILSEETYHEILKRKRAQQLGIPGPQQPPVKERIQEFITISLIRPISMLFTEPLIALICCYVACEFATLYSFFAAVPYVFRLVYRFNLEQQGLVFISLVIGCFIGTITVVICDVFLYRPQIQRHPRHHVPPEYRLYPAMIASLGMPLGLFWFGWAARSDIPWSSPAAAIIPFTAGNLCLFVSTMQYLADVYHGNVVASAISANSVARYGLGGIFPLFTLQSMSYKTHIQVPFFKDYC
jgi:MFS family permease